MTMIIHIALMRKLRLREKSDLSGSLQRVEELGLDPGIRFQQLSFCSQFFVSLSTIRSLTLPHLRYL